jgi:hypothetical protein
MLCFVTKGKQFMGLVEMKPTRLLQKFNYLLNFKSSFKMNVNSKDRRRDGCPLTPVRMSGNATPLPSHATVACTVTHLPLSLNTD